MIAFGLARDDGGSRARSGESSSPWWLCSQGSQVGTKLTVGKGTELCELKDWFLHDGRLADLAWLVPSMLLYQLVVAIVYCIVLPMLLYQVSTIDLLGADRNCHFVDRHTSS